MLDAYPQFCKIVFAGDFSEQKRKTGLELLFFSPHETKMSDDQASAQHIVFVQKHDSQTDIHRFFLKYKEVSFL